MGVPIVRIEGNIGAGKSSLLRHLDDDEPPVDVLCEPVEGWACHLNGLYASSTPEAWRLPMQALAMCTRAETIVHSIEVSASSDAGKPLVVERSRISANIFAYATLEGPDAAAFETLSNRYDCALADAFDSNGAYEAATVYLQTSPETCAERIRTRSRRAEDRISPEYLRTIHDQHETMFATSADIVVECDGMSSVQVAQVVKRYLSELMSASM
jgi:deoxyadenosine/deoxycytidine kinase